MKSIALAAAGLAALGAWARRSLIVVTVDGSSMEPTYRPGDRVLVRRRATLARGAVVVVAPSHGGWLIKRVAALPGDPVPDMVARHPARVPPGALVLLGDGRDSVDSRQLGFFARDRVLGTVVRRLRPAGER